VSSVIHIVGLARKGSGDFDGYAVGQLFPSLEVGFGRVAPAPAINNAEGRRA
jgi:hypothetical protein